MGKLYYDKEQKGKPVNFTKVKCRQRGERRRGKREEEVLAREAEKGRKMGGVSVAVGMI